MRAAIASSGVLGTGVTLQIGDSTWREVHYGGVTGWVNGRYLERVGRRFDGILPEDMDCEGTEPFWTLRIRGRQALYEDGVPLSYSIASRAQPVNRNTVLWAVTLVRQGLDAERILIVRQEPGRCDTGMSAHEFPYSALILGSDPDVYRVGPFMGCCSMPR